MSRHLRIGNPWKTIVGVLVSTQLSGGLVVTLCQEAPPPVGGGAIGVDISPTTYTQLVDLYQSQVTSKVNNLQTQINVQTTPGTTGVDPYKRDANGAIQYDANGNPVMKNQAEITAEIEAAKAKAIAAGVIVTPPPASTNGATDMDGLTSADQVNIVPEDATLYNGTSTGVVVPDPTIPDLWPLGNPWTLGHTVGLTLGSGGMVVDQLKVAAMEAGINNVIGGGTAIPANVGNPETPVVIQVPKVCKCCGAPVKLEPFSTWIVVNTAGYYAVQTVLNEQYTDCGWMRSREGYFKTVWLGPGSMPCQNDMTRHVKLVKCDSQIIALEWEEINGHPCPSSEGPPIPTGIAWHAPGVVHQGNATFVYGNVTKIKMVCDQTVPGTTIMKDRCENGHWQEQPCPTTP